MMALDLGRRYWNTSNATSLAMPKLQRFLKQRMMQMGILLVADAATGDLYWKPDYVTTGCKSQGVNQGHQCNYRNYEY